MLKDAETEALDVQPQPYAHRVLLHGPELRNIPVFALAHEQGRSLVEQAVSTDIEAARAIVGEIAAQALQAGR